MLKIGITEEIILDSLSWFTTSNNLYNIILKHPIPSYGDNTDKSASIIRHFIRNDEFLLNALKEYKDGYRYIVYMSSFEGCIFAKDIIGYVDEKLIENYYGE